MENAYVYDGLRTPIGRHAGGLAPVRPDDLLGGVIKELIGRNPFKPQDYEDAVVGCTNQAGEDARNVARHAALLAGCPPISAASPSIGYVAAGLPPWPMPGAPRAAARATSSSPAASRA